MRDDLDDQIEAYETLLPTIREKHGSVWALIAHKKLVSTFADFAQAAKYVRDHLMQEQVLIRHTDEATESAPYVHIEG